MFDWDSGWELGRILKVTGSGSHARQARIQFEIAAAKENPSMAHLDQSTMELREDNYLSAARPNGQWLMMSVERQ